MLDIGTHRREPSSPKSQKYRAAPRGVGAIVQAVDVAGDDVARKGGCVNGQLGGVFVGTSESFVNVDLAHVGRDDGTRSALPIFTRSSSIGIDCQSCASRITGPS